MIVDCTSCAVRGDGCPSCVVTVLFGGVPGADVPWHGPGRTDLLGPMSAPPSPQSATGDDVDRAIAVLAAAGLLDVADVPVSFRLAEVASQRSAWGA